MEINCGVVSLGYRPLSKLSSSPSLPMPRTGTDALCNAAHGPLSLCRIRLPNTTGKQIKSNAKAEKPLH
jgi:hypothetical protein